MCLSANIDLYKLVVRRARPQASRGAFESRYRAVAAQLDIIFELTQSPAIRPLNQTATILPV